MMFRKSRNNFTKLNGNKALAETIEETISVVGAGRFPIFHLFSPILLVLGPFFTCSFSPVLFVLETTLPDVFRV